MNYPNKNHRRLFKALLQIKNSQEAAIFFRDLLTLAELDEFAKRWQIAKLLDEGLPYTKVAQITKTSTTTVTRVAHWLRHGTGGYKLILKRLN